MQIPNHTKSFNYLVYGIGSHVPSAQGRGSRRGRRRGSQHSRWLVQHVQRDVVGQPRLVLGRHPCEPVGHLVQNATHPGPEPGSATGRTLGLTPQAAVVDCWKYPAV